MLKLLAFKCEQKVLSSLQFFLLCACHPLYHYQNEIERLGLYYNPQSNKYSKSKTYFSIKNKLQITQSLKVISNFSEVNDDNFIKPSSSINNNYKNQTNISFYCIKKPFPIHIFTAFLLFMGVKSFSIVAIPSVTATPYRRHLLSTAVILGKNGPLAETVFLLWTVIGLGFYLVTLSTTNLLDFRFLALFRMTTTKVNKKRKNHPFHPEMFGKNYNTFKKF